MSNKFNAGDQLLATEANRIWRAQAVEGLIAGETIAGDTLPVSVYQSKADNKYYACDGNDDAKLEFQGFAISDADDTEEIEIQMNGIIEGFTGLVEGTKYYVQDDKTIGTTSGTYKVLVGIAVSETELLIIKNELTTYKVSQTSYNMATASGTQVIAHGLGRIPKIIRMRGSLGGANFAASSQGAYDGTTNSVSWVSSAGTNPGLGGGDTTNSIRMVENANVSNSQAGVISVDGTNITITWTKTGSPTGTAYIQWEVEG